MIRKFKTLGLALVAVLAMSAVVATAVQAQFTASSYPKSGTAESALGNDTFNTEAGVVQCKAHFAVGPLNAASSTVTVTPTYTGCTAFGFSATVNMNGCSYTFHDTANNHQNQVTISCPAGKEIVIVAGPCEAAVPGQGTLGVVGMTNQGNHVMAQANVAGITYKVLKDGFLCPFNPPNPVTPLPWHKTGATYVQHNQVTIEPIGGGSISVD